MVVGGTFVTESVASMIIENPTQEGLVPYLGRMVTVLDETGRLALVLEDMGGTLYAGLTGVKNNAGGSTIRTNLDHPKINYIGPMNISLVWKSRFDRIEIHDPVRNFTPTKKWWLLGIPLLLRSLFT